MSFLNNFLNKPKKPIDEGLMEYENGDYFREKAQNPSNTENNNLTQEEYESLLFNKNAENSQQPVAEPINFPNQNNVSQNNISDDSLDNVEELFNGISPDVSLNPFNQDQDNQNVSISTAASQAPTNPVVTSQAPTSQGRIYNEDEWKDDDSAFDESVQGTIYQEQSTPNQGFYSPQITFNKEPSVPATPNESKQEEVQQPSYQAPPSFQPTFQEQQVSPSPSLTFQPPQPPKKQPPPQPVQQQIQPPYNPTPTRQPPSFIEESDDIYEEEESTEPPKPVTILDKVKELLTKAKESANKKSSEKPAKPAKKKNEDSDKKSEENDPKKVAVLIVLLFVLAGVGYYAFTIISPSLFATHNNATQQNKKNQNKKGATILVEDRSGNIPQNPFVSKSQVPALAILEGVYPKKELPKVPNNIVGTQPVRVPAQSVPSVPSFTPPAIPQVPQPVVRTVPPVTVPARPSVSAPTQVPPAEANEPPKLTGIIETDGQKVAVMSDGTVVSSGDTYNDGRIAYIGGDGIHFDNGKTLKFEE